MLESEKSPVFPRAVTLISRDAPRLADFYENALGFARLTTEPDAIELGAGGVGFLRIENRPEARPFDPASTGLFHIAYLLPNRDDLARWFVAARAAGAPFEGASDHAVSEAFYLTDPEGNGIEIYVDRARDSWPKEPGGYAMTTGPMALRDLVAQAGDAPGGPPSLPAGTRIGHIHLQTGDAEQAARLWQDRLGLVETHRRPGARFLSWGGYHHHIALNNWRSRGAHPREPGTTGLGTIEFAVRDAAEFAQIAQKAGAAPGGMDVFDFIEPGGLTLKFRRV